jgi:hypothetical protein
LERELDPANVIARMPILGNIAYISVALLAGTAVGMRQFSWRIKKDIFPAEYYAAWTALESDLGSTNYWDLATMIADYGMLGIWAAAFVTEILATFGIAPEVNVMVWAFGVGLGGLVISLTYNILMFLAIQTAYGISSDSTKSSWSAAASVQAAIQQDWISSNAAAGFIGMCLFTAYGNWWASMEAAMEETEETEEQTEEAAVEEAAAEDELAGEEGDL